MNDELKDFGFLFIVHPSSFIVLFQCSSGSMLRAATVCGRGSLR
jgi:hypothetical protein